MMDSTPPAVIVTPGDVILRATDEATVHGFALAEVGGHAARLSCEQGVSSRCRRPPVVAAFLADQAKAGVRPSTLSRRSRRSLTLTTWLDCRPQLRHR